MMTSRRGSIVATIFLFSILLSTVPQDACAFGFSGGWGGGSSSNRLTISGPGYSRTVGQDGSVKQSFEQTTTGKSKRSSGSVGFNIGFGGGSPGGSSSSGGGCPSNPGIIASIAGCVRAAAAEQAGHDGDAARGEPAPYVQREVEDKK